MENLSIRNETPADYRAVEELLREAFWDVYAPGCTEHYLAHLLRGHPDFIPALDLVACWNGELAASVMYTKARLVDEAGQEKPVLTFGPVGVLPRLQRRGIGKALLAESFAKALGLGYDAIVIFGNPGNYVSSGFKSCKKFNVCSAGGGYPTAMLVKELRPGVFDGRKWFYHESPAFQFEAAQAQRFDEDFPPRVGGYRPSQEEFYIYSHSSLH